MLRKTAWGLIASRRDLAERSLMARFFEPRFEMCSQAYNLPRPNDLLNIVVSPQVPKSLVIFEPLMFIKLAASPQNLGNLLGIAVFKSASSTKT